MFNPDKLNKEPDAETSDAEAQPEILPEAIPTENQEIRQETTEKIEEKIEELRRQIEESDKIKKTQETGVGKFEKSEKIKNGEKTPEEFGFNFKQKLLHEVAEFWPIDRWLQKRAEWLIRNSDFERYLKAGGQYLDVGTGKGHIPQRILEDMEKAGTPLSVYYGIDVADKPSRKVQEREAKRKGVSIHKVENPMNFVFASADALPFEDESLDGVSYIFSIHHMNKHIIEQAMGEAKRVIKRDGYIFIVEDLAGTDEQKKVTERRDRLLNVEGKKAEHNYKSDEEWQEYFDKIGLTVVAKNFFKSEPVLHGSYVLRLKKE